MVTPSQAWARNMINTLFSDTTQFLSTTTEEMNAEGLQHLASDHDHNREGDHGKSAPTEEIIKSRVLEMTDKSAIIDEQKYEHQDDR